MYTYKGKTYNSQSEIAAEFGLNRTTLNKRLLRGMSLNEAIESETLKSRNKISYNGKEYISINKLALELNIKTEYLYNRIKKGMSIKKAVAEVFELVNSGKLKLGRNVVNKISSEFIIWNESFSTINAIEEKYNLCKNTLSVTMNNKTMQEVIVANKEEEVSSNYKNLESVTKLSRYYNVQPSRVYQRLKNGWGITEAIIAPVTKRHGKTIKYKGIEFAGKGELASHYGIDSIYVDRLSKSNSISWVKMFELIEEFLLKNNLNELDGRPEIIGKTYIAIYNNIWFDSVLTLSKEMKTNKVDSNDSFYFNKTSEEDHSFCFNYKYEWNKFIEEFKSFQ